LEGYLLQQEVGTSIEFSALRDNAITGNFEVTVNEKLIHSKRSGMKHPPGQDEFNYILEAVQIALQKR